MDSSVCIYCRVSRPTTVDHVPPKCIFPEPRPTDLITVPSCEPCNSSYALDDEYFRVFIGALAYGADDGLNELWKKKVVASTFRRSPKLRRAIEHDTDAVRRAAEEKLGTINAASIMAVSADRIVRVIQRIVRGLLWHHYRLTLGDDVHFDVTPDADADALADVARYMTTSQSGAGLFRYRHAVTKDRGHSLWFLQFSTAIAFLVWTRPRATP